MKSASVLINRQQAAERYSCSLRMIDALLAEGVLPCVKLSRRFVRIPLRAADEVMLGQYHRPEKEKNEEAVSMIIKRKPISSHYDET